MAPYEECKGCVASPFCKRFSGEAPRPEHPEWCNVKFRLYKALELSRIPKAYLTANIYNYKVDADNQRAHDWIKGYIDDIVHYIDGGQNFFFYCSRFGTGKTFHASMLLNHFNYKTCLTDRFDFENPHSLFMVYADLMDRLRYSESEDVQADFELVRRVPLLLLDDVGSGTMTDYVREQTYLILNHRFNNNLSTIITANMPLSALADPNVLGGRNASRIKAQCDGIEIGGADRRRVRVR